MKLFVWSDISTGAYHEDGAAVVIAEDEEAAKKQLATVDGYYEYSNRVGVPAVFDLESELVPQVVLTYEGCDC